MRRLFLLLLSAVFSAALSAAGDGAPKTYVIGEKGPAGGYIVYDRGAYKGGWRYLEAAPEDQSSSIMWWDVPFMYVGGTGTAVGTGRANTSKIIKVQGGGNYAAKLCADYRGGGKKDWFLPSKKELTLMRSVLTPKKDGGMCGRYYWSSSEVDGSLAWRVGVKSDEHFADGKDSASCVRALRAF